MGISCGAPSENKAFDGYSNVNVHVKKSLKVAVFKTWSFCTVFIYFFQIGSGQIGQIASKKSKFCGLLWEGFLFHW